jgi:nucleoid-associated protein YgaU
MAYTVQGGDTLYSIAAAQLGDGNRWPEIAKANNLTQSGTDKDGNPVYMLRIGQPLQIPGK